MKNKSEYDYTTGSAVFRSVATLDENPRGLTCSALAATAIAPKAELKACRSFEEAAAMVKAKKADAMFVPAAYPKLGSFLMDETMAAVAVFLFPIPALVLASVPGALVGKIARLFHHPATTPLLPKAKVQPGELVPMSSNTAAAVCAVETGGVCITNSACAAHFGLRVHQVLRSRRLMPFIVFVAV